MDNLIKYFLTPRATNPTENLQRLISSYQAGVRKSSGARRHLGALSSAPDTPNGGGMLIAWLASMRRFALLALVLIVSTSAVADDVYLKNGRVFEDVEAEVSGDRVIVYLPFGEIGFSRDVVERIEESVSTQAVYRQRRDGLVANPGSTAGDWLELARWATSRGFEHGAREAAMRAASLDPSLESLGAVMRDLEFAFDPALDRWIPLEEKMRRDGYRRVGGEWLSAEQLEARARLASEAARTREAEEERRLTRAVVALAAAQIAQNSQPPPAPQPVYSWPATVYPNPFIWRHPSPFHRPPAAHDPAAIPIERRQPGSLFPIQNRGRMTSPPTAAPTGSTMSGGSG